MRKTKIQWCHSTVNPIMGCDGCELWKPARGFVPQLVSLISNGNGGDPRIRSEVVRVVGDRTTSGVYRDREVIASELDLSLGLQPVFRDRIVDVIRRECKCYAGQLGTMRAGHKGYADQFERPKLFPGRMAEAAKWGLPTAAENGGKPWLVDLRRLIFISDMGDALSSEVPFDYLESEIIANVTSPAGSRHVWLWLTKRPERMAQFGEWLLERGCSWPVNLVAMTTVTSQRYASRVDALRRVPAPVKGLSLEPLFERVELDLKGIHWVIVGGGSDTLAEPFHAEWALDLRDQCKAASVAFFLKQLGRRPFFQGKPLKLADGHGGDWSEWPEDWRVRELPNAFQKTKDATLIPSAS